MARTITLADGSQWKPSGGSARNYVNLDTGQVLSRRQFDKRSERLGQYSSYEAKAKATPAEVRAARPARGRALHPGITDSQRAAAQRYVKSVLGAGYSRAVRKARYEEMYRLIEGEGFEAFQEIRSARAELKQTRRKSRALSRVYYHELLDSFSDVEGFETWMLYYH